MSDICCIFLWSSSSTYEFDQNQSQICYSALLSLLCLFMLCVLMCVQAITMFCVWFQLPLSVCSLSLFDSLSKSTLLCHQKNITRLQVLVANRLKNVGKVEKVPPKQTNKQTVDQDTQTVTNTAAAIISYQWLVQSRKQVSAPETVFLCQEFFKLSPAHPDQYKAGEWVVLCSKHTHTHTVFLHLHH